MIEPRIDYVLKVRLKNLIAGAEAKRIFDEKVIKTVLLIHKCHIVSSSVVAELLGADVSNAKKFVDKLVSQRILQECHVDAFLPTAGKAGPSITRQDVFVTWQRSSRKYGRVFQILPSPSYLDLAVRSLKYPGSTRSLRGTPKASASAPMLSIDTLRSPFSISLT